MRRKLLVLTVALMLAAMMSVTAGAAWGQVVCDPDDVEDCLSTSTKDECKDGGWKNFTTGGGGHQHHHIFKNQGDCVSFFATGGKNLPAG
jgi:hypothetical protein